MKKKNLLGLLLVMLMGVCANQAYAYDGVTYTLTVEDNGVEYDLVNMSRGSDSPVNLSGLRPDELLWISDVKAPVGKLLKAVKWNGEELTLTKYGVSYGYMPPRINSNSTLVFEVEIDAAIESVDADSKAVYYADGVVYNQAGEIAIYDVTGKLVVRTGEATVDTQDFANGIYIVRSAKGAVKFVK